MGGENRILDRGRLFEPLRAESSTGVARLSPSQEPLEESKRGAGVGGERRILDRGRSFEPLKGMKTKLEEAKRANRR